MNIHSVSKYFMWKKPFQSHLSQIICYYQTLFLVMYFQTYCVQLQQKHIASFFFFSRSYSKHFKFLFLKTQSDLFLSSISFLLPNHLASQRKNNPARNFSNFCLLHITTFQIPSCKFARKILKNSFKSNIPSVLKLILKELFLSFPVCLSF